MALNGLFCADVPLRNYSLTHSRVIHGQSAAAETFWILFYTYPSPVFKPCGQGRRSLWDRGDTSPQYLDWGDIITNVPPIFLE